MNSILPYVLPYLDHKDIAVLSITCSEHYMNFYHCLQNAYDEYIKSDTYKKRVIRQLNYETALIQDMRWSTKVSNNKIYEFLLVCYECWTWLSKEPWRSKLKIPTNSVFCNFLKERGIDMNEVLPTFLIQYTHVHRPSKQYSRYEYLK